MTPREGGGGSAKPSEDRHKGGGRGLCKTSYDIEMYYCSDIPQLKSKKISRFWTKISFIL